MMVSDGQLETVRSILINVKEVNAPPVARDATFTMNEDSQREIVAYRE